MQNKSDATGKSWLNNLQTSIIGKSLLESCSDSWHCRLKQLQLMKLTGRLFHLERKEAGAAYKKVSDCAGMCLTRGLSCAMSTPSALKCIQIRRKRPEQGGPGSVISDKWWWHIWVSGKMWTLLRFEPPRAMISTVTRGFYWLQFYPAWKYGPLQASVRGETTWHCQSSTVRTAAFGFSDKLLWVLHHKATCIFHKVNPRCVRVFADRWII